MHPDLKAIIDETPELATHLTQLVKGVHVCVLEFMLDVKPPIDVGGCAGARALEFLAEALRCSSQGAVLLEHASASEQLELRTKWSKLPHVQLKAFIERATADPENAIKILTEMCNDASSVKAPNNDDTGVTNAGESTV